MRIKNELEKIIQDVKDEKFLLAQDKFEKLWRKYKNNINTRQESFILKAFVNACVYFELYKLKRYNHASNLWNTFKKYEYLINEFDSLNKKEYLQIQKLIYKKKEKLIDDNIRL